MKKLALLVLMMIFAVSLAACNRTPEEVNICLENPDAEGCPVVCPTGQVLDVDSATCVLVDNTDPLVCPTGQHEENDVCVVDTLNCPEGQHEDGGACVLDPLTEEEILVQYILTNWDADLLFLAATMEQMDFSEATTITTEVYFELTEDSEVMYFEGVVEDSILYAETGNTVQRFISLDLDGEQVIEFTIIVKEVETGVHVYLQPELMVEAITAENEGATDVVNWLGFDKEWAVFHFDDSLQAVLEVEVLKDMVVGLFFAKAGAEVFNELQLQIETAIGFDLDVYGVDLDLFMQYIIAEDFDSAELLLQAIDTESILLHADFMYVAWQLYNVLMPYAGDLTTAGFDVTQLAKLNTASIDEAGVITLLLPVDPLDRNGTVAFFEDMDDVQLDLLVENAIKPIIEDLVYQGLLNDVNPEYLYDDFLMVLQNNEMFLTENWPEASGTYDPTTEYALYVTLGPVEYWRSLSEEEQMTIHWAIDISSNGWIIDEFNRITEDPWNYQFMFMRHEEEIDIDWIEANMIAFINGNSTEIDAASYSYVYWLDEIGAFGVVEWYLMLGSGEQELISTLMYSEGNETHVEAYELFQYLLQEPYNYSWQFTNGNEFMYEDNYTYDIMNLISMYGDYLTDEYGYDVDALLDDIESYGGITWYMEQSTETDRNVLMELGEMEGERSTFYWTIFKLQDIYDNGEFDWWFGRPRDFWDIEYFNSEVLYFLSDQYTYIEENSTFDVEAWSNHVAENGAVSWFDTLGTAELEFFQGLLDMPENYYGNVWVLNAMFDYLNNEGQYNYCYGNWETCVPVTDINETLIMLVESYSGFLLEEYGIDYLTVVADIEMYGAVDFYLYHASEDLVEAFDHMREQEHYAYELMWKIEDILYMEADLLDFLETHEAELNAADFDATAAILDIATNGLVSYVEYTLDETDIEVLVDVYVYPLIEGLQQAIVDDEVLEFVVAEFFTDVHVVTGLASLVPMEEFGPLDIFDADIIAANMIAIDFDAMALEVVDLDLLSQSVYEGQVAYDLFVAGLTSAPNYQLFLEVFSPGVLSLEDVMVYVDDLNYAFDGLVAFEEFIDPSYYITGMMDVDVDSNDDLEIVTTMSLDGVAYAELFGDVVGALGVYMTGFEAIPFPYDEDWTCIDTEFCEDPDFTNIIQVLAAQGELELSVVYDPSDLTWMSINLDATDFLNVIAQNESENSATVNAATLSVTMEDTASITLPTATNTTVINDVVDEVARFAITVEAYEMLRDYAMYFDLNPTELEALFNDPVFLSEIDFLDFSDAFDLENSFIEVSVDMVLGVPVLTTLDYEITLKWVDGTDVFTEPVGLSDLLPLLVDGDLADEAAYHTLAGMIDDDNWALTKLWLFLLMDSNNNETGMHK